MAARSKIVVVLGTNASGKSALGVELATRFDGEVVSADSRQVYRGLDLGTGKLTAAEMRGVPHHLIDVADVRTTFSLSDYQRLAYASIDDILVRQRLPLLVGGTGLYISAVVDGYALVEAPPDANRRAELNAMSPAALAAEYQRVTGSPLPPSIDPRNSRRLTRAIEIASAGYDPANLPPSVPRYDCLLLGLTWPHDVLRNRIAARLDSRLASGMLAEVSRLLDDGVPPETLIALGLEYKYLTWLATGRLSRDEALTKLAAAISRFSRRQVSWFKRMPAIHWLDVSGDYTSEAAAMVDHFLAHQPVG